MGYVPPVPPPVDPRLIGTLTHGADPGPLSAVLRRRDDWFTRLTGATFPEPPMYCTRCGGTMVRVEHRQGWTDRGVRVIVPGWSCPKAIGWLSRLTMRAMMHDEFEADVWLGGNGWWRKVEYR